MHCTLQLRCASVVCRGSSFVNLACTGILNRRVGETGAVKEIFLEDEERYACLLM